MAGVLQGLKVVEFTHMVAGPACGQVLGDFGADITKVEPPQGDITRRIGPMAGDMAALYASTNRNKKVICIDITDPSGAKQARELGINRTTLLRLLHALESERFIEPRSEGEGWRIGVGLITLTAQAFFSEDLVQTAVPVLTRLAGTTTCTPTPRRTG